MLARLVIASLLLELAVYAAAGAWLWAVPFALGIRLALVCFTMTIGWIAGSPRTPAQRLGALGTLRLVFGEWRTMLLDNFAYLPFERRAMRPDPVPAPGGAMPILVAHGYMTNRGYFRPLVRALEAAGIGPIFVPNFRAVFSNIETYADELEGEIERIATATGHGRVILVCHSMGGLAAREYLRRRGGARIARLVTIASPHHGTVVAYLGVGKNGTQMRRGSDFLAALEESERRHPPGIVATSVYSCHDNLVVPQDTSRLPWARNVALPGLGHIDIIGSKQLLDVLLAELRAPS
jgi:pimeloyl-ACP methyl ester carboxylesterase